MEITVQELKRVDLLTVVGRVDSASVQKLEEAIESVFNKGRRNFAFDLSGVNYMSSAGLRALVAAKRRSGKLGNVVLVSPSERVQEVLELAGLTELFESFDSTTEAVGSF